MSNKIEKVDFRADFRESTKPVAVYTGELGLQVNSRQLHRALGSRRQYANWIRERIAEYDFVEGTEFLTKLLKTQSSEYKGGRGRVDYIVTVDMAKELAMVEKNEAGRAIRRYFIEAEKRYREWVGAWLPYIEQERDLFGEWSGYNYVQLVLSLNPNTTQAALRSRIGRNRQEFRKNQNGVWYVSEEMGKNIIYYYLSRRHSAAIRRRNLEYRQQRMLQGHGKL